MFRNLPFALNKKRLTVGTLFLSPSTINRIHLKNAKSDFLVRNFSTEKKAKSFYVHTTEDQSLGTITFQGEMLESKPVIFKPPFRTDSELVWDSGNKGGLGIEFSQFGDTELGRLNLFGFTRLYQEPTNGEGFRYVQRVQKFSLPNTLSIPGYLHVKIQYYIENSEVKCSVTDQIASWGNASVLVENRFWMHATKIINGKPLSIGQQLVTDRSVELHPKDIPFRDDSDSRNSSEGPYSKEIDFTSDVTIEPNQKTNFYVGINGGIQFKTQQFNVDAACSFRCRLESITMFFSSNKYLYAQPKSNSNSDISYSPPKLAK